MSKIERRKHSPQFKADIALKAIETGQVAEIGRQYGLTPGQVSKWVSYLKENGSNIFVTTPDKEIGELKSKLSKLEQLIGKKEIELSLMKNFMDFYGSKNGK